MVLPFCGNAQDSISLPPDYSPQINWEQLSDSLYLEYKEQYPQVWRKDSLFKTYKNKRFFDSVFTDDNIAQQLFFGSFNDSTVIVKNWSELPPSNSHSIYKKPLPTWFYLVVLMVIIAILFLKYLNLKQFNSTFFALISVKHSNEALREYDSPINLYNLLATLVCAIIYSFFFWFVLKEGSFFQIQLSSGVLFVVTFVILAIFYLLRYLVIMIAAVVLDAEYVYSVLVQTTLSGNLWITLIVLPCISLLAPLFSIEITTTSVYIIWLVLLVYLLAKQVRVYLQVVQSFPHSIIYLILYLCALEIAPYLAIYKLLVLKLG